MRVADYILSNPLEAIGQSITELAGRAGVSDATVTRFCTAIELSGYPELRKALASALGQAKDKEVRVPIEGTSGKFECPRLRLTRTSKDILTIVKKSNRLILLGFGDNAFLCEYLVAQFSGRFPNLMALGLGGAPAARKHIGACCKEDAVILFPSVECSSDDQDIALLAEQIGVAVVWADRIGCEQMRYESGDHDRTANPVLASLAAVKIVHRILEDALIGRSDSPNRPLSWVTRR